jgi:CheY-like chemotaxis protein
MVAALIGAGEGPHAAEPRPSGSGVRACETDNVKNFCILQVEDSHNDILLLQHAFRAAGITNPLQTVRDGQAAMDYLSGAGKYADRNRYPLPCLVLLDLQLPRIMGLNVLKWIRHEHHLQTLPVIVFTSSGQRGDIDRAYRAGANAFLTKPSGIIELTELMKVLKAFWLHYNQPPDDFSSVIEHEFSAN